MNEFNITVENHTFHGYEVGERELPALICLHGMTGDSNSFLALSEFLCENFHLILIDSPGHGQTQPLEKEEDYWFSILVGRIEKVITQLVKEPFYLLGHSWGADLALHFAKAFPESVKGVILFDGGYVFPEHIQGLTEAQALLDWDEYIQSAKYKSWDEVVKSYQEYTTKKWDESLDSIICSNFNEVNGTYELKADRFSLLSTIKAFYKEPCSTTFDSITCPVLLFHATLPETDPARISGIQHIRSGIKDVKIVGIDNTKHNVHWDKPEVVAREILLWKDKKLSNLL